MAYVLKNANSQAFRRLEEVATQLQMKGRFNKGRRKTKTHWNRCEG